MDESWIRHIAEERGRELRREAAANRLARATRPRAARAERQATLLDLPLLGRRSLRVELWSH